jgi:serine O-acetyltransferase
MLETTRELSPTFEVSATDPDWSREKCSRWWHPSCQLLRSIRSYQKWSAHDGILSRFFSALSVINYRFWSVVTGADIPLNCQIAGGLVLPHPNGIVVHPKASIGPNCLIFQQVTIVEGVKIGGHVDIGAGAKIIRAVTIGDHAKIGANAVVLCDVPAGATAIGIPAKLTNL